MILMIQQFCVEFAKVKDANDLQKLISAENYLKQQLQSQQAQNFGGDYSKW